MRSLRHSAHADQAPQSSIRHIPALDGLRGLAVAGVLLFHGGHLVGGYLGVDLFFVLSGFLITSLLLAESGRSGTVGLGGFWARRARRLLPALGGVLVGVALYSVVFANATELARIRGDALATIGYVANWRAVFAKQDYWALFTSPSPLDHTWSLAIEEQFYVLWPLVFVGLLAWWKRSTPMAVLVVSLVLAGISTALMFALYSSANVSRVYYGTDTRAGGILLGAALAAWLVVRGPVQSRAARIALEVAAVISAAGLALAWSRLAGQSSTLYRGGFLLCGVAVVAVIAAAAHPQPGPVARTLSFTPFRLLGLISYGVYLWHWPIDVVLNKQRTHLDGWWLFGAQTAITLVIAVLSYRLLEQPIRQGALSSRQWRGLTPAVAVALVLVLVVTTQGAKTHAAAAPLDLQLDRAVKTAQAAPPGVQRVMIVGNSVAFFLGDAIRQLPSNPPIVTLNLAEPACFFPANLNVVRIPGPAGFGELRSHPCQTLWSQAVERFRPDIVVWALSADGLGEGRFGGKWSHSCQAGWDNNFERSLRQAVHILGARGATVVITTAAYPRTLAPRADHEADCDNRSRRKIAAETSSPVVDLFERTCPKGNCHRVENGVTLRPDGLHYEGEGAKVIGPWVLDQLRPLER